MKNQDIYRLKQGCEMVARLGGVNFSWAIVSNLRIFQVEIEKFDKIVKPTEEYTKTHQPKVEKIAKKYCLKDKDGIPIPRRLPSGNSVFDFTLDNKKKFDAEIEKLEELKENVELIKTRKNQLKVYEELMNKDSTIKLETVKKADVPKDITPAQMDMIFEMIVK